MQDCWGDGEHWHSTGANAAAHIAPASGSGLHLWNSKQNKDLSKDTLARWTLGNPGFYVA